MIKADEITPVQKIGDYYFKRDDLFMPFDFSPANGSKLRQCILLVQKNAGAARMGLFTGTSVHSPQAVITASVAKSLGVGCTIVYGGLNAEQARKHKYYNICKRLGARVEFEKVGYTSAVSKKAEQLAQAAGGFAIHYGFDLRNNIDVFMDSVAQQVCNIPDELDYLVVTCGSAITISGIMLGVAKYKKNIRYIVAVGCAPNRENKIKEYANMIERSTGYSLPIERLSYCDCYNKLKGYKYEQTQSAFYYGIVFHPRYEAKTFNFMQRYIPKGARTLMWVVGHDI